MEANEHVWPGEAVSYMRSGVDAPSSKAAQGFYPISSEVKAREWIEAAPEAYCNPDVPDLPEYLSYAQEYYRWQVSYGRKELEEIIKRKSGHNIGLLKELKPLDRGESGRISRLAIIGSEGTLVLERELEIRCVLSESHLYSSCFVVDYRKDSQGQIEAIDLRGAGWGHGVGLCQVGATMMAVRGKSHDEILAHYYRDTSLKRIF
jgi:SpoIID/LytB domain protein